MNYNRMTIRNGQVFKVKPQWTGYATDMGAKRLSWIISRIARPLFTGTDSECRAFIKSAGAEFQEAA